MFDLFKFDELNIHSRFAFIRMLNVYIHLQTTTAVQSPITHRLTNRAFLIGLFFIIIISLTLASVKNDYIFEVKTADDFKGGLVFRSFFCLTF